MRYINQFFIANPTILPLYAIRPHKAVRIHIAYEHNIKLMPQTIRWNGIEKLVGDYELFTLIIKGWMKRYGWSKEMALDEYFDMQ